MVGAGAHDGPSPSGPQYVVESIFLRGVEGAAPYRSPSGKCEPRAFGAVVRILYSPARTKKSTAFAALRSVYGLRKRYFFSLR